MKSRDLVLLGTLAWGIFMAACGNSQTPAGTSSGSSTGATFGSLPTKDDRLEPALQGQVPQANQNSGDSALGYRKGLRLVGQNTLLDRGQNLQLAWIGDCAYVTTGSVTQLGGQASPYSGSAYDPLNGMAVIDAADPKNPKLLSIQKSPAMLAPHEALQANAARHIIIATRAGAPTFELYDASDCRNPVLRSTIDITPPTGLPSTGPVSVTNGYTGHAICISDDGMFAVATSTAQLNAILDLSDLDHPKVLKTFMPAAHDCGFNPAGDRLYLALFGFSAVGAGFPGLPAPGQNGLMIMNFSDYQNRIANPSLPMVGFLGWNNDAATGEGQAPNAGSHTVRWFKSSGHPYLFSSDEWPSEGVCPWAHGRILDIGDETHPVKLTDLRLAVQDTANCGQTLQDNVIYSAHYVGIDNVNDATTLFATNYAAGLRVWDIHDPAHPKEIAYWHPVPNPNTAPATVSFSSATADAVMPYVRYRPESGQIWVTGAGSGFQILQFTETAGPTAPRPTGN